MLSFHIADFCASDPLSGVTWQPMFSSISYSLKTFLIIASSCKLAWIELETFLFENLFHPHFLCLNIARELWSFVMRHTEIDVINKILERLCILSKVITSREPAIAPLSSLRTLARSISCLLTDTASMAIDQVYTSVTSDEKKSYFSSVMLIALLLEGFPLDSLSDNLKMSAIQKIVTAFWFHSEQFERSQINSPSVSSELTGLAVHALSSSLRSW